MHKSYRTIKLFILSLVASFLSHILFIHALGWFGTYDMTRPVMPPSAVMVDLTASTGTTPESHTKPETLQNEHKETARRAKPESAKAKKQGNNTQENRQTPEPDHQSAIKTSPQPAPEPLAAPVDQQTSAVSAAPTIPETFKKNQKNTDIEIAPPLHATTEFIRAEQETLSYRITLLGLPVGSGVLEAKQEKGDVKITLRVTSSLVIASIYPVDDLIETRLRSGNYIITKIRQQEGTFRGDRGFTLFLREKSVFWIDLIKQVSIKEALPNSDVLDILSGLYYLRNRPLQVGKMETLEIFDSTIYTTVPVEVLRHENIFLPGFRQVDTLLLHPIIKTEGIFKRAGDILIWVTNDENHVPVRVETAITLGKVTAELTDSEIKHKGDAEKKK